MAQLFSLGDYITPQTKNMFSTIDWDTSLVLTVILAPLCLVFVGFIFVQWGRIKELVNEKTSAVNELGEFKKAVAVKATAFVNAVAQKDNEIERKKKEIERLNGLLNAQPTVMDATPRRFES